MISIIICSVNTSLLTNLKKNIAETIGVPYEIIAIDNSKNNYGICKAYNEGGGKAKYSFLCFMHEDIYFESKNWGALISEHFKAKDAGLLGIAGGDAKSIIPSSWSISIVANEINIIQYKKNSDSPHRIVVSGSEEPVNRRNAIALDGVWLCTKKEIFDQFKFDETIFPGFHGYDIDFSLQVGSKYKVFVIFDILIHHFSEGNPDKKWVESAIAVSKKWKRFLPRSVHNLSRQELNLYHWRSLQVFMSHLFRLNYNYPVIIKALFTYSFNRFFSFRRFLSMGKYILLMIFRKGE